MHVNSLKKLIFVLAHLVDWAAVIQNSIIFILLELKHLSNVVK